MGLRVGETVSHYRVVEEIARGGMGIVFRAVDLRFNQPVALKILQPQFVSDRDRRKRFVREAKAASSLEHPNVAVIHEIGEERGIHFIAMELIRGEQLRALLEREPLTVGRALDLAIQIGEGLARAHEIGILHRDIKPENVMVTRDGQAKLIDFGLAKLLEHVTEHSTSDTGVYDATQPGMLVGTLTYMSPEQARGEVVDRRSDIFSFGILVFEILTGKLPFAGRSPLATLDAIAKSPMPRLTVLGSPSARITMRLQQTIAKCLAKEPSLRYSSLGDLLADLRTIRDRVASGSLATRIASLASSALQRPMIFDFAVRWFRAIVSGDARWMARFSRL